MLTKGPRVKGAIAEFFQVLAEVFRSLSEGSGSEEQLAEVILSVKKCFLGLRKGSSNSGKNSRVRNRDFTKIRWCRKMPLRKGNFW